MSETNVTPTHIEDMLHEVTLTNREWEMVTLHLLAEPHTMTLSEQAAVAESIATQVVESLIQLHTEQEKNQ